MFIKAYTYIFSYTTNLSIFMVRNGFSDTKPRIITDTQGPINEIK